ncbi:uncharacterized protein LOC108915459 [Anoplophora glabripennis]|uniref:uncharacterized protein LOC108915459 n=1 Tax=Anoplophora glabripennis TaxID=217634 RepID=UPI0008746105|nr:uncharacterized protein LOC108915459 [Anoplophora glabripennis]
MRVLYCVSVLYIIALAHCGVLTQIPTAVTTSQRIGGNFAYSTVESAAVPSIVHNAVPITYATAPLTVAQPLYTQSIFGSPFLNPIISSPFYPGIVGQAPVIGQAPIFGQPGVVGQLPGQGQGPIQAPVAAPSPGSPQGPAPPPPGATVDDDTVSVESA